MKRTAILGVDIAKSKFDVCLLLPQGQLRQNTFANNEVGFAELRGWLRKYWIHEVVVGIEATGCYWVSLAHALYSQSWTIHLLNPAYVKAHVRSTGTRSKTDRVDARLIADYVATHRCEPWAPLPGELEELRELMRLYADATNVAASLSQRSEALRTTLARQLHAEITATLKLFARKILQAAKKHAQEHASLHQPMKCLESVCGIGTITALVLVAELPRGRSARSVAGWAGVTPKHHTSGQSVRRRPKLSKQGSHYIRRVLYLPALTALRFNPVMRSFGDRLHNAGLTKMQIVGAAMHKLLRWAVGIMNSQSNFDPNRHLAT